MIFFCFLFFGQIIDSYDFQILNLILSHCFQLTLRKLMDVAKHSTKSGNLNEFSMVLLNNFLSLPLGLLLILIFKEWQYLYTT
jgi:GDP-mannose transporter